MTQFPSHLPAKKNKGNKFLGFTESFSSHSNNVSLYLNFEPVHLNGESSISQREFSEGSYACAEIRTTSVDH